MISVATESDRALPKGWRWVKLGEVCENVQSGFASGQRDPEGVIQLRMNNLDTRGNFVWDDFIRVPASHQAVAQFRLELNDVLFNNTNSKELVGKSALFTGHAEDVVFSNHFTRIRTCPDALSPSFLAAWLNQQWLMGVFASICNSWIGQSAVKPTKLLSLEIPLPPLPEQKRIAAILNEQMAAVERARKAAEERLAAVNDLPAAYLRAVFPSVDQPQPKGWRWVRLGDVSTVNPSRPNIDRPDDEPTTFVPMEAVDAQTGTITASRLRPYGEIKKGYTCFSEGDVLFAKITPCMQNGKHAVAAGLADDIGFGTTEFHVIRPGPDITPQWIHSFLRQPSFLQKATEHFTGAVGQQRLPPDYLKALEIPLPPLPEQKRIAAILNEQMAAVERARKAAEEELATINAFPAALLRRAFRGEL